MLNQIDLSRTDLNLLVLFETVLEELHVGRAAERLNLSASAVSHGLGRLRRQLNDPLFLKTPKGVVPTERALALAEPIADILIRVRGVVSSAVPFDPCRSSRRFRIGAADGFSIFLPPLLAEIAKTAPAIDIVVKHMQRETALADLDSRAIDVAVAPFDEMPARFAARTLYDDDFIVASSRRASATPSSPSRRSNITAGCHICSSRCGVIRAAASTRCSKSAGCLGASPSPCPTS
jgi:DNA-binding transcriptional LysR family regulator